MSKNHNDEPMPPASTEAGAFVDRLAERLGTRASAATIYADPIERDGVTIIPVAKVRYGFGGGGGSKSGAGRRGGGGGVQVSPVGYIELKNGGSEFLPIDSIPKRLRVVSGIFLGSIVLLRLVRKIRSH
ncbi:MAG: spore germination protein GerW family protein [Blastocatellia bacterium]